MREVSASASRIETERVETTQAGLCTCLTPTLASLAAFRAGKTVAVRWAVQGGVDCFQQPVASAVM